MYVSGNLAFNAYFENEFIGIVKKENASMFSGPGGTLLELHGYFPSGKRMSLFLYPLLCICVSAIPLYFLKYNTQAAVESTTPQCELRAGY